MSELSQYLTSQLGDRVADDVVISAAARGHQIDRTAVYAYLRGDHAKHPRESTLAALAAGFGVDVRKLRELAGRPPGELGEWKPTPESASLTREQRDSLDALIKAIVRGGSHEVRVDIATPPGDVVVDLDRDRLTPKQRRMLEDAQPVEQAAYNPDTP